MTDRKTDRQTDSLNHGQTDAHRDGKRRMAQSFILIWSMFPRRER